MDDIYFSDKNKRRRKDETSHSKKIVTDKFVEGDFDNENRPRKLNKKDKPFKVDIPDFDMDIPEPGHITAPSKDIYSSNGGRIPQGKRVAPVRNNPQTQSVPHKPASPQTNRIPQGQRVRSGAPQGRPQQRPPQSRPVKKSHSGSKIKVAFGVLGVLVVLIVGVFFYGYSALGGLNYDDSIGENIYLKDSDLLSDESVRNILFIGSDAREGLEGQRSDSMILFSIDKANKKIKLTSFLRDSYVYIPSKGYSTKLNAAFNYGGAQLLMDTLEYNFGVNIDDYIMVDYDVFIDLVNLLGGVTISDVTEKEARYMQQQVNRPKFKEGTNKNVDGRTAMWYCRIRYVDNDFGRTQRQRKVLTAIISKATKTNPFKLVDIVKQVLPHISTSIDRNGLLSLGMGAFAYMRYDILQQQIPAEKTWRDERINGQDVIRLDFTQNKEILKDFIYG